MTQQERENYEKVFEIDHDRILEYEVDTEYLKNHYKGFRTLNNYPCSEV